jgi:hypothetical protein
MATENFNVLKIVFAAEIIQPVAVDAQKPGGFRLHLFGLLKSFRNPPPLEGFHFIFSTLRVCVGHPYGSKEEDLSTSMRERIISAGLLDAAPG